MTENENLNNDSVNDNKVIEDMRKNTHLSQKKVIRLDRNFHVYIHGDNKFIEEGKDENGRFLKLYFKEMI